MPKLAPTFSEIFDYKAYEEDTVGGSMVEDEKPVRSGSTLIWYGNL